MDTLRSIPSTPPVRGPCSVTTFAETNVVQPPSPRPTWMKRTPSGRHERPKAQRARYRQREVFRFARALLLVVYAVTGRAGATEAGETPGADEAATEPAPITQLRRVAVALPNEILQGNGDGRVLARAEELRRELRRGVEEGWLGEDEASRVEASIQALLSAVESSSAH